MLTFLAAIAALPLVLYPADTAQLAIERPASCEDLRVFLGARQLELSENPRGSFSFRVDFRDQESVFSYGCADTRLVTQALVARQSSQAEAVAFYTDLEAALKETLGSPLREGERTVSPRCLLKKSGLVPFESYNSTWQFSGVTVVAAVFEPPAKSPRWRVGFIVRRTGADPCGERWNGTRQPNKPLQLAGYSEPRLDGVACG